MSSSPTIDERVPLAAIGSIVVVFGLAVGVGFGETEAVIQVFRAALVVFAVYLLYRLTVAVERIADGS